MKKFVLSLILVLLGTSLSFAQNQQNYSSTEIYNKIEKLNFLGTVLYVAAHPDDENTSLISYLSNKTHARVGYLSLTRGDGGQNLIGPEMRELLGLIRTEELLAARRIDGGMQFFTRANDFGYSKTPVESFNTWDKEKVLSDVVWVFRKFRPDVIVNRFDHRTQGDTHGHHTASARLSVEAFDLSGAEKEFPNQLQYYKAWQPKKLYVNISWLRYGHPEEWKKTDKSKFLSIDLGTYLPLKGRSNQEISAKSRSQHKSQGFGVMSDRGKKIDYFERIKGDFPKNDDALFAGINTTWSRVAGGKAIGDILYQVQADYNFKNPAASVPELMEAYQLIKKLKDPYWRRVKTKQIKEIIAACAGLYLQVSSAEEFATVGETVDIKLEAINRSSVDMRLEKIVLNAPNDSKTFKINQQLTPNIDFTKTETFKIPEAIKPTDPYWLRLPHSMAMYKVPRQQLIGLPETPPAFVADFQMYIDGVPINFKRPLIYKTATPKQGELKEPFAIVPKVSLAMHSKTLVFAEEVPKKIQVDIKAFTDKVSGVLRLKHPEGWKVTPREIKVEIDNKGKAKTFTFMVNPPKQKAEAYIRPEFSMGDKKFSKRVHIIAYPHIRTQVAVMPAQTKAIRLDIETRGKNIAYIEGSGDKVAESLRTIGYDVDFISAKDMSAAELQTYDAVILGIRAYNTNKELVLNQDLLFDYVKEGGTLITQYNKSYNLKTEKVAPYALHLSHNRVTDEQSPVEFLAPESPVLNTPNKITLQDFKGWVQERGLYFPDQWSDKYTAVLGMHDPGEKQLKSSLLVARYGEGHFVYTGLSFFRELPAGVAGAYRLFANLIALGNEDHQLN